MTTDVTEFKVSDFADKVKDKIKASFVDLIPEEKWDELVNAELNNVMTEYTCDQWSDRRYNNDSIQAMIKSKICEIIKEKINKDVADFIAQEYDTEKQKKITTGLIEKFVLENADKIFSSMVRDAVQNAVEHISVPNNTY